MNNVWPKAFTKPLKRTMMRLSSRPIPCGVSYELFSDLLYPLQLIETPVLLQAFIYCIYRGAA
jgi:hypothetical protein